MTFVLAMASEVESNHAYSQKVDLSRVSCAPSIEGEAVCNVVGQHKFQSVLLMQLRCNMVSLQAYTSTSCGR